MVASALAGIEGLVLVLYAVLELFSVSSGRLTMGLTTSLFFLAYGVGLLWCAWAVTHGRVFARSPLVLAQLIQLGLAYNFWGGATTTVSVVLGLVALIVIVGLLHPASIEALSHEE